MLLSINKHRVPYPAFLGQNMGRIVTGCMDDQIFDLSTSRYSKHLEVLLGKSKVNGRARILVGRFLESFGYDRRATEISLIKHHKYSFIN